TGNEPPRPCRQPLQCCTTAEHEARPTMCVGTESDWICRICCKAAFACRCSAIFSCSAAVSPTSEQISASSPPSFASASSAQLLHPLNSAPPMSGARSRQPCRHVRATTSHRLPLGTRPALISKVHWLVSRRVTWIADAIGGSRGLLHVQRPHELLPGMFKLAERDCVGVEEHRQRPVGQDAGLVIQRRYPHQVVSAGDEPGDEAMKLEPEDLRHALAVA